MLYSCGNVIVLVLVHFIDNWVMMILVALYVYLKINAIETPKWAASSHVCGDQKFNLDKDVGGKQEELK